MIATSDVVYALAWISIVFSFVSAYTIITGHRHSKKCEIACLSFLGLAFVLTIYRWQDTVNNPQNHMILIVATISAVVLAVAPRRFLH